MTWEERIRGARKRGGAFTMADKHKVGQWPLCAVGERHHLPRTMKSTEAVRQRVGSIVQKLGFEFMYAVKRDDPYVALQILDAIAREKKGRGSVCGSHSDLGKIG